MGVYSKETTMLGGASTGTFDKKEWTDDKMPQGSKKPVKGSKRQKGWEVDFCQETECKVKSEIEGPHYPAGGGEGKTGSRRSGEITGKKPQKGV